MAWECPACSEINEADDLIKCICGFELTGDPKEYKPSTIACPECEERNINDESFCEKCGFNLKLYDSGQLAVDNTKYRTFGKRFWAGLIDGFILVIPLVILNPWIYSSQFPTYIYIIHFIFNSTVFYFYSVLMHGRYGQTVGKMICKVKVIDKSEKKAITYKQALMRDIVIIVIGLIGMFMILPSVIGGANPYKQEDNIWGFILQIINVFWFYLEIATMMTKKKRRAIHDYIAGTVVVRIKNS